MRYDPRMEEPPPELHRDPLDHAWSEPNASSPARRRARDARSAFAMQLIFVMAGGSFATAADVVGYAMSAVVLLGFSIWLSTDIARHRGLLAAIGSVALSAAILVSWMIALS
jgi:hypothetical protein